jgi:ribosomal protein S18 acetylase RimI-like enzyme
MPHAFRHDSFLYSDDPSLLDMDVIHGFLSTCYWSPGIPRATLARAIAHSLCFGVYDLSDQGPRQVGFARVVSDRATYAYLCDVFVVESFRGRGLSKRLVAHLMSHPDLQGLRRFALLTRDAQGLYERFGFKVHAGATSYMEVVDTGIYLRAAAPDAEGPHDRGSTR